MSLLEMIRNAIAQRIALMPYDLYVDVYPTKDNGYGKMIPDYSDTPVNTHIGIVTIARRRIPDTLLEGTGTPYVYSDMYYMLIPHTITTMRKNMQFTYKGERFKTNIIEKKVFGDEDDIGYYICNLEQITNRDIEDF